MASPGLEEEQRLRGGGFDEEEISQWRAEKIQELSAAGFSNDEINKEYFGVKEPNLAPLKTFFKDNLAKAQPAAPTTPQAALSPGAVTQPPASTSGELTAKTEANSFLEAMEAGWQISVEGLIDRGKLPDKVLAEDAPMFYRIASQLGTLKGDIPDMIAGSLAGSVVGGVAGPIGSAVGAGAGGFAMPAAIREALIQAYKNGEVKDFGDFWERASSVFIETAKNAVIGGATGGAGAVAGKLLGPAVSPLVSGTTKSASEIATMVTVGKAIEGEVPQPHDFAEAAILVGGLHASTKVVSKLHETYAKTGLSPSQVGMDALKDPIIKQELASENIQVPRAYEKLIEPPPSPKPEVKTETPKVETKAPEAKTEIDLAREKIREQIGTKEEPGAKPYTKKDFYKDFVDKLDPINEAQKVLNKNKETLPVEENSYLLSRMANDSPAKVKHVFEKATLDYQTLANNGKSFAEITEPFKKDILKLQDYLVSKRTIELENRGIKSGFDKAAAEAIVKDGKATYEKGAKDYVDFENRNLKYLKDSGVISEKSYQAMTEVGMSYVPFRRLFTAEETGQIAGKGSSLRSIKGSDKAIQNIFVSTLENAEINFKLAEKNRAIKALIDLAESSPEQTLLKKVSQSKKIELTSEEIAKAANGKEGTKEEFAIYRKENRPLGKDEFFYYRDGAREVWKSQDPALAEAIKSLDGDVTSANMFFKIAKGITTVKKFGIAIMPDFTLRNLIRDQATANVFSKYGPLGVRDLVGAMGDIFKKNDTYYNWLKAGGAGGTFLELNQKYLETNIFKLNEQTGFADATFNILKKPVDFLRAAGQLAEQSTRLAEFKRVTKGETSGSKIFEGGFASREITLDFQRIGAKMSALNGITAFQNVSIQGLDRSIRAAKADPAGFAMRGALYLTAPSVLLWWANKDDKRVAALPRWQKDMFWIIPTDNWEKVTDPGPYPEYVQRVNKNGEIEINTGTIYRIPKPQELGLVFGTLPERLLESFFTENPRALKDFEETILNLVTPSFVPDAITPPIEQYFNKSLFTGGPIIPGHLEGLLPAQQYTEYSSETAKAIGKMVAVIPGMDNPGSLASPQVLDNYIRSWSGTLGSYTLQVIDKALTASGAVPDPIKPDSTLADIPFVKAFVVRFPSANAQQIVDFRERYRETKAVLDTIKYLAKSGNSEYEELIDSRREDIIKLDGINTVLTKSSKAIRDIYKNKDMTSSDKRQIIDGMYWGMIKAAEEGLKISDLARKEAQAVKEEVEKGLNTK